MKKILLSLAAAALCTSAFAAEPTVLYERAADTWTDADLAEWVNNNAQYVTQTIDGGLKMTASNSDWTSTKEMTYTENSVVTVTATLFGGQAPGRSGSYDFLKVGDVEVRLNGQDKVASIAIGETTTNLSGFTRGGDYNITITVDQASKNATVTVAGGAAGEATGKMSAALPNNVVVGHYKAGKENYAVEEVLKAIKVAEEVATPEVADLYERTADTWTDADLAEWVNNNAQYVTQTIDGGLKMTASNSDWTSTKEMTYTENSVVTVTATLFGGQAPGRSGSYDFLKVGDVEVRLNGQDKVASIAIGETTTNLSGFTRGGDYNITIIINQASKDATVTVAGGATGEATGKIVAALPNNVVVGHYKAGKENYAVEEVLKAIKVSEEIQAVIMTDYTINYMLGEEIVKTENGTSTVGDEIKAVSPLTVDGQKYYFADGATTSMVLGLEGENVLNVAMRKAYVYNYTVKNNVNDDVIEGSAVEGESVTVPYKRYIIDENGDLWLKDKQSTNPHYGITIAPDADNFVATLEYTKTDVTDAVWYSEAEDIEGMTYTDTANTNIRCSNGAGGYSEEAVEFYTLQPGTYNITIGVWGNAGTSIVIKAGDAEVLSTETLGYWFDTKTEEALVVKEATTLTVEGGAAGKPVDYILITGTPEVGSSVADMAVEAAEGKWFNLQGVEIAAPTAKGIYIHNGKKVVVK